MKNEQVTCTKLNDDEELHDLEFHGLKLIQKKKGFKFGVDSVLLSDYAKKIKKDAICVDIGSGTGIISILLAEKTNLKKIYGIEIQKEMADMSQRSVELNRLQDKVCILNDNIKNIFNHLEKNSIDIIVSNPPYKKLDTGILNPEINKLISRHEVECKFDEIAEISGKLLKDNGVFYLIHRPERLADVLISLRKYKLEPKSIRFIQSKINEAPKMFLLKAVKGAGDFLKVEKPLIIYNEENNYTDEVLKIYEKNEKK